MPVAVGDVPIGVYGTLEFQAEDVALDQADEHQREIAALREEVRAAVPEWPGQASLSVSGTFAPEGGEPVRYTTYAEAEVEVEVTLDPPLEIPAGGGRRSVTLEVRPGRWFVGADGTVTDLAAFDWATTGRLYELGADFEAGFLDVESEED